MDRIFFVKIGRRQVPLAQPDLQPKTLSFWPIRSFFVLLSQVAMIGVDGKRMRILWMNDQA